MTLRLPILLALLTLAAPASALGTAALLGEWEAAVSPDNERLYIRLRDKGKAEIVSEYDFQAPGQSGKQRGRGTAFGKWTLKGNDVILSYANVHDRLRYSAKAPLSEVGLTGSAPALRPVGKVDPKSRIGAAILWKAPHEYKLKSPQTPSGEKPAPGAAPVGQSPASPPAAEGK
jgi:hypothetical protein